MDTDGILRLIDAVLPFEVCLYHQVIPLTVKDAKIHLGMVDRDDENALKYLQNLFQHTGYTVIPNRISAEAHQFVMSAYLTYSNQRSPAEQEAAARSSLDWLQAVSLAPTHHLDHQNQPDSRHSIAADINRPATVTTATPDDETSKRRDHAVLNAANGAASNGVVTHTALHAGVTDRAGVGTSQPDPQDDPPNQPQNERYGENGRSPTQHPYPPQFPTTPLPEIHPEPPNLPISMLVMLPPHRLLPALLAKALSCGIGRLFFERRQHEGRILYSQDGQQQAVLEALPLDFYQATLDRLKQFMTVTPDSPMGEMAGSVAGSMAESMAGESAPAASPKPALEQREELEGEFLYRSEQVLLRLTLIPGNYGEEATLQVLRGKAMQFYQERKLEEWGRDALSAATNLHRLLNKIQSTLSGESAGLSQRFSCLSQLEATLMQLEAQIHDLSQTGNVTKP